MFDESCSEAMASETAFSILNSYLEKIQTVYFADTGPLVKEIQIAIPDHGPALLLPSDVVLIHPQFALSTKIAKILILHELVHCHLRKRDGDADVAEGDKFQAEIRRLIKAGAYEKLL
jgi:hypothetical protein